ncbi:MAG TPA: ABC transporter ATP-binding protein [Actinomycetota bacterium]|nr:ABC transporter ATP-binding protein [Actinomycetota bacterium]
MSAVAEETAGAGYIRVEGLSVSYDGVTPAVTDLDMEVRKGEFVAVLGPSGCGKSTLLHVMSGVMRPQAGRIEIGGHAIDGSAAADSPPIGYVFQDHRLLSWRTVGQNIAIVLQAAGVSAEEIDERIDRYLEMLHIDGFRDTWPMRLSGGQRQRVSIARALALQPAVVLMDEPFSTLDEVTARLMRQQLAELWQESGHTIVFVTHSIREALFLADRIYILTKGPARVFDVAEVPIERPRRYEDPKLTELEGEIVDRVLGVWGIGGKP